MALFGICTVFLTNRSSRQRDKSLKDGGDVAKLNHEVKMNLQVCRACFLLASFPNTPSLSLQVINSSLHDLEHALSSAEQGRKLMSTELARRENVVIDLLSYRDRLELLAGVDAKPLTTSSPRPASPFSVPESPTSPTRISPARHQPPAALDDSTSFPMGDDPYASQDQLLDHQDRMLDEMSATLRRHQQVSLEIAGELDDQVEYLGEFEEEAERTNTKFKAMLRRMERKTGVSGGLMAVILLVIVIVIFGIIGGIIEYNRDNGEETEP